MTKDQRKAEIERLRGERTAEYRLHRYERDVLKRSGIIKRIRDLDGRIGAMVAKLAAISSVNPPENHESVVGKYRYDLVDGKWQVQKLIGGEWKVVYYCADRYAALKCVRRCRARAIEWSKLSQAERRDRILREEPKP